MDSSLAQKVIEEAASAEPSDAIRYNFPFEYVKAFGMKIKELQAELAALKERNDG